VDLIKQKLTIPTRTVSSTCAMPFMRITLDEIYDLSKIDPWFLKNIEEIVEFEKELSITRATCPYSHRRGTIFPKS